VWTLLFPLPLLRLIVVVLSSHNEESAELRQLQLLLLFQDLLLRVGSMGAAGGTASDIK